MGIKDSLDEASIGAKIAFCILFVATFFSWLAFTTTGWAQLENDVSFGLWRMCSDQPPQCSQLDGTPRDWFNAVQAFAIFGFVLIHVSFFFVVFYIFGDSWKADASIGLASGITGFVAGAMWLIAVVVFGTEYGDLDGAHTGIDLEYSFWLAVITLLTSLVGGMTILVLGRGREPEPTGSTQT